MFSQQLSGGFALRTSYIATFGSSAAQEVPELCKLSDSHVIGDPWDEIPYDPPEIQFNDPPAVKSKQCQKTPGVRGMVTTPFKQAESLFRMNQYAFGCLSGRHSSTSLFGSKVEVKQSTGQAVNAEAKSQCTVVKSALHWTFSVEIALYGPISIILSIACRYVNPCIASRTRSNISCQQWTNSYLSRVTLKSLGLQIQLGHQPGEVCPNREAAFDDDFVVIDAQSIHTVALNFCGCERATNRYRQLLSAHLFPAMVNDPRTAATFSVMELFHILSFESKITAFEFFHTIARQTDNTGLTPIRVSFW